jgi:hypothetical protein
LGSFFVAGNLHGMVFGEVLYFGSIKVDFGGRAVFNLVRGDSSVIKSGIGGTTPARDQVLQGVL